MGTFLKTTMGKKTQELRQKDKKELESLLEEHREQLAQLRIEQQSSGNATKLSKIREVRKSVARIQTVINQETLHQVRKKYQKGKDARHRPRDPCHSPGPQAVRGQQEDEARSHQAQQLSPAQVR